MRFNNWSNAVSQSVFVRIDELSVSYRGVEKQCRFSENSYKVIASGSDLWSE
jgi:hypothetical protein